MKRPTKRPVKKKVWAATAGALVAGGAGFELATAMQEPLARLLDIDPSLAYLISLIFAALLSAAGAFGSGWLKTETVHDTGSTSPSSRS